MKKRVMAADLGAQHYPVTVELIDYDTGEVLWRETAEGPGVMHVPSFRPRIVKARATFGDGTVEEAPPTFLCPRCGQHSHEIKDVRAGYCAACRDWTLEEG